MVALPMAHGVATGHQGAWNMASTSPCTPGAPGGRLSLTGLVSLCREGGTVRASLATAWSSLKVADDWMSRPASDHLDTYQPCQGCQEDPQ
jgi:hypothetical protein